jgi:phosphoglycerol geranylgeranyltransferase
MSKNSIYSKIASRFGQIALLIDPDKTKERDQLKPLLEKAAFAGVHYIFVGGSTVTRKDIEQCVHIIKKLTHIPVVIFPGANHQLSAEADALLYLSLVSGRNPDYLISHHVNNALEVFELGVEILPTAYILVDGGTKSSVAYVSQTTPIPQNQTAIATNTALAAIMQGKKIVYYDAGSGAIETVPLEFIENLKQHTDVPIIVGGGIKNSEQLESFKKAKVNVMVIGNRIEEEIDFLLDIKAFLKAE